MAVVTSTNYYSLLLIPLGIIILIFVKFGADLSFSNRRLLINSNETDEIKMYITELILRDEIREASVKNDKIFIFKDMALGINEFELFKFTKLKEDFLGPIIELYGLGVVHENFLLEKTDGKLIYKNLFSRLAYENFVKTGNLSITKDMDTDEFLRSNKIFTYRALVSPFEGKYKIVKTHGKALECIERMPYKNNASILFLSSIGFIEEIN